MRRRSVAGLIVAVVLVSACGGGGDERGDGEGQTLTVFAASSLTEVFTELGERFEAEHEGATVRFSFGGSSDLATQIEQGAPADVFASANPAQMARVVDAGEVSGVAADFAANTLQIAVPPGNPAGITSLADLEGDVDLVLCAPQ
ncbi:molybdate ABC transporter substrate-binding protein, partial [cyanobacterium TDX16]